MKTSVTLASGKTLLDTTESSDIDLHMYTQLVFYKDADIIQSFLYIFSNIHEEETLLLHAFILEIIGLKRVKAYFSPISNILNSHRKVSQCFISVFSN